MGFRNYIRTLRGGKTMAALPRGKTAPPISLADFSGKRLSLAETLKRGPVLAAFFKVSCPTCQFTMPFLERLHQKYGGGQMSLLGISPETAGDTPACFG